MTEIPDLTERDVRSAISIVGELHPQAIEFLLSRIDSALSKEATRKSSIETRSAGLVAVVGLAASVTFGILRNQPTESMMAIVHGQAIAGASSAAFAIIALAIRKYPIEDLRLYLLEKAIDSASDNGVHFYRAASSMHVLRIYMQTHRINNAKARWLMAAQGLFALYVCLATSALFLI